MLHTHISGPRSEKLIFRSFLPWFLLKNGCLLILASMATALTNQTGRLEWLLVTILLLARAVILALRYTARAVILRGNDLIVRTGTLRASERVYSLSQTELRLAQGPLGLIFDYGTVTLLDGSQHISLSMIGSLRALRYVVAYQRYLVR